MRTKRALGIFLLALGTFLVLNSASGVTGAVIGGVFAGSFGFFLGLVFVISGIGLLTLDKEVEINEILSRSQYSKSGNLLMRDSKDALRYTDLQGNYQQTRKYGPPPRINQTEEETSSRTVKYQQFIQRHNYLDNEAAKMLLRDYIPERLSEMIKIAKKCYPGGRIEKDEGDGNRVYDEQGNIIAELGNHAREDDMNIQKGRLVALARGYSNFRQNDRKTSQNNS